MQPPLQTPLRFQDFTGEYIIELANKYGYTYSESVASDGQKSSLYNNEQTNTHELHKLSMVINGIECSYYTALYDDVNFKSLRIAGQQFCQVQVFEVSLPYDVEDLYISSRTNITFTNILGSSDVYFNNSREITLEGDFSHFFKVFTPADEELTAFTILAPNIMERLLRDGSDYNVEFSGNKIYFYHIFKYYTNDTITLNKQSYNNLLNFGIESARIMTRAGRPAKQIAHTASTPMWKLYGQTSTKKKLTIIKVYAGFLFISLCIIIPFLWPILILIILVFIFKWRSLISKRKKLIKSFTANL